MILAKQSGLRPAVVGALLVAILSLTAIDPACAQAATPTDAHSTLTPRSLPQKRNAPSTFCRMPESATT